MPKRAVLVLLALAVSIPAASGAARLDPKTLVLRLSDLPAGFRLADTHRNTSPAQAAKDGGTATAAQYRKWGFVGGYRVEFEAPPEAALQSVLFVGSRATVYRSRSGAAAALAQQRRVCGHAPFHRLSAGVAIGDRSVVCSLTQRVDKVTAQFYVVAWTRGRLVGSIYVGGVEGVVSVRDAVALAQKQDRRMGAHGIAV